MIHQVILFFPFYLRNDGDPDSEKSYPWQIKMVDEVQKNKFPHYVVYHGHSPLEMNNASNSVY